MGRPPSLARCARPPGPSHRAPAVLSAARAQGVFDWGKEERMWALTERAFCEPRSSPRVGRRRLPKQYGHVDPDVVP